MAAWEHNFCGIKVYAAQPPIICAFCVHRKRVLDIGYRNTGWTWRGSAPGEDETYKKPRAKRNTTDGRRKEIYKRDGHACVNCGATKKLTLDHKIPLSRGGTNEAANLQTMCKPCNGEKANKLPNLDKARIAEFYVLRSGTRPMELQQSGG